MNLATVSGELLAAKPVYASLSPSWPMLAAGPAARLIRLGFGALYAARQGRRMLKGDDPAEVVADVVTRSTMRRALKRPRLAITKVHQHIQHAPKRDLWRKNGLGGRSWYATPGRQEMVLVFHDANRAGPHVDVHLGRVSLVYRVKPDIYEQLKYNREGYLTEDSRKLLLDMVRTEIEDGARVPQNLDHTRTNAKASWVGGDRSGTTYGSGPTRQVIHTSEIDVYKTGIDQPMEMYAPGLRPDRNLYLYRLYPGDDKRAPICIFGAKNGEPGRVEDRLHLKMLAPEQIDQLAAQGNITAKYDGSSCYVVITPKGTTVWSPRQSKADGRRIEYTGKVGNLAQVTSDETIVAMGELLFTTKERPWSKADYVPQATGGGYLNANAVLPRGVHPEIRLYRVDRINGQRTTDVEYDLNRLLQYEVAELHPTLQVVEAMTPDEAALRGFEGIVAVPQGASVNDGIKVKWWQDADDWRIDKVAFTAGERGGIAGVVHCTSLESGKTFKLGPGQVGNRELNVAMMTEPDRYEGAVLKVQSRHGHEGRAAKVVGFHDDKGTAA